MTGRPWRDHCDSGPPQVTETRVFFEGHVVEDGAWVVHERQADASPESWKRAVAVMHTLPPPVQIVEVTETREVVHCASVL